MKCRKRQYLQWFWWSSRMIMSCTIHFFNSLSVLSVFNSYLLLSFSNDCFVSQGFVKATDLNFLSPRVVFTKQGPVQGFLGPGNVGAHYQPQTDGSYSFQHYSGRPVVEIFKGIPYASPPVGNLRYESPTPPPLRSRAEIYWANSSKVACPVSYAQIINRTNVPNDPIRALKKTMELEADDCLYLDIYAPLTSNKNRGTGGLPVLVYANSQMDDPEDPFDGSSMAAIGNIIVISFHYRIGVLGFVRPGFSDDIRSNFGLWDQLAALQWIKENVEEFGGDSNNICLMGYDLDASLTGLISLSPVSQAYNGLFHRLILLNGSPFSPHSVNHQPQKTTFQLARYLKCPLEERSGELANCLRRAPTPQLFGSAESIGAPLLTYPFAPIADGTLVPIDVSRNDQRNSQTVLDMLGKYDLLGGLKEGPVLPRAGMPILRDVDVASFVTAAIKLTLKLETDTEPTDQLKRAVTKSIMDVYGKNPPMREMVSDFLVVYPMNDLLRAHSTTEKNTFFYVFKDFDPLRLNKHNEISYIFSSKVYYWKYHNNVPDYRHLVQDIRAEELKPGFGISSPRLDLYPFDLLIRLLSNFVRSGDPNVVDPNERFPNEVKPWPKFEKKFGRYLELGKEVSFPSGYRKANLNFWDRVFPSILKSFANQSAVGDIFDFDVFPPKVPNFPPWKGTAEDKHKDFRDSSRIPVGSQPPIENAINEEKAGSVLSGIGQNTVVLIGALLLLLNFLCFIGLFYQRERLKKTEIQLRTRFLDARQQNPDACQEMETTSSFERAVPLNHSGNHITHGGTLARDAMSETETENGFGPDFLGPNYDPRTKVNRWMNMQNAHRAMLSKDNSFDHPGSSINSDFHIVNRRETDMPDPSITVLPLPPPLQPSATMMHPQSPPLHIQVTSLQRNSQGPKFMPMPMPMNDHAPIIHILPPLPYQEPYQPSASLVSDIPYADSRNTSPLTISVPKGYAKSPVPFQNKQQASKLFDHNNPPPFAVANVSTNLHHQGLGFPCPGLPPSPVSPHQTELEKPPKRTSVIIVRDLDPIDDELSRSETKLVPVKTGTLKRSVGVDTGHDGSPARKESSMETQPGNKRGSSQVRVTFSEKL